MQFTSCDVDCSVDFGDTKSYTEIYIHKENYEVVNGSNRLCNLRLLTLIAQSNRGIHFQTYGTGLQFPNEFSVLIPSPTLVTAVCRVQY